MEKGAIRRLRGLNKKDAAAELSRTDRALRSPLPICLWRGSENIGRKVRRLRVEPSTRHKIARMNWQLSLLFYRKELRRKL